MKYNKANKKIKIKNKAQTAKAQTRIKQTKNRRIMFTEDQGKLSS